MQPSNRLAFKIAGQSVPLISMSYSLQLDSPCGAFQASVYLEKPFNEELKLNQDYLLSPASYAGVMGNHGSLQPLLAQIINPTALIGKQALVDIDGHEICVSIEAIDYSPRDALHIAGRDKIAIVVDSSASTLDFEPDQDLLVIAKQLCAEVNIPVKNEVEEPLIVDKLSISPGETIFNSLEQAAAKHQVFFMSVDGHTLKITKPKNSQRFIDSDSPIIDLRIKYDISERFGTYELYASNKPNESEEQTVDLGWPWGTTGRPTDKAVRKTKQIHKIQAIDDEVNPLKKKVIVVNDYPSPDDEERRLEWEKNVRKMKTCSIEITLAGVAWFQIGTIVPVDLPFVAGDFLVKATSFSLEGHHGDFKETTTLSLVTEVVGAKQTVKKNPRKPKSPDKSGDSGWPGDLSKYR